MFAKAPMASDAFLRKRMQDGIPHHIEVWMVGFDTHDGSRLLAHSGAVRRCGAARATIM